ncbi:MAG: FGGY-family carbohydrate kinase [Deltaproteobacteria bacterium]|nr:FGGY-family carbohydrate kinase [Deltaproteobacteria bacterium]
MNECILAIDNGTQSVRAIIFDLNGNIIAASKVPLEAYFSLKAGWAEQEPEYYWESLCVACQNLWQMPGVHKEAIIGVTLTTQRSTVINLDEAGKPLRPAIVWLDQRRVEPIKPLGGYWGALFKIMGLSPTIAYLQSQVEASWISQNQPEIWAKTHKYLLLSGYLSFRLTGEFRDSVGSQVAYIPFDYKKFRWAADWDFKWKIMPVAKNMLPELVFPTGEIGRISKIAADATGIPADLPLIASAADKACEVLGSGANTPEKACLSYGTTATINVTTNRYMEPVPLIPAYPSAIPHHYSVEFMIYRGFWLVSWFKGQFASEEQKIAKERGITAEDVLEEMIRDIPPGSNGLMLQPFWSPGLRFPGLEAKGAIVGFCDVHTKAHVYRAILEGIAFALNEGKERIEAKTKTKIEELRVAGGGSQSAVAMQLTADIFNLPASRPHTYEASALGAAMDVAVGLKVYPDFTTAVARMVRTKDVFMPNTNNVEIYAQLYKKVYKRLYKKMKPLYEDICTITKDETVCPL